MRGPMHAVGQKSTVCVSFLCPNEAVAYTPRRVTCKARGYGARKVIVGEQVDNDQDARRGGQPWPWNGWENDVQEGECAESEKQGRGGNEEWPRGSCEPVSAAFDALETSKDEAGAGPGHD